LAESDLDNDEVALLAVESAWVRRWGVRYSSGVDEVGGGAVSRSEEGLLGLEGKYPLREASWGLHALRVTSRCEDVVSWVLGYVHMSSVTVLDISWEWCEPIRWGLIVSLFRVCVLM